MRAWSLALGVVAAAATLTACAGVQRGTGPEAVAPRATVPPAGPPPAATAQTGRASWYGDAHHGKQTASGEIFDMTKLTAAHRTLPFGARVRVTNVANGRSVVVRINDRGPFTGGRIIDLSQAAARELGALGTGLFSVRLEVLEDAARER